MININRDKLLKDLFDFSKAGSGLIVGNPGVGKSFLLNKLKHTYLDGNHVAIMIRIDNLVDASDEEIQQDLNLESNWIKSLQKVKIKEDVKALLIFDAFDAARNDTLRSKILKQIQRAKSELSEKWNIIVSVRTYDAAKSQKLIELFPLSGSYSDNVYCRKTVIPSLTDIEVITATQNNIALLRFFEEGKQALKSILKIPFFLNIADKVIPESTEKELLDLKKIESETQLLKIYWQKKIVNTDDHIIKEKILLSLTNILVNKRSLNCALNEFIPAFTPEQSTPFEYLRSENIITETLTVDRRIAFSHNILFDYAVSILYLQNDIEQILIFINEEPSRPFFLRPSFVYFFAQLWFDDNASFWSFFWRLNKEDAKEIKLFVRLVLTGVIASEYSSVESLNTIFDHIDETERNLMTRNTLQSIRFLRKKATTQDIALLEKLSKNLAPLFLWDFAFLLDRAINDEDKKEEQLPALGKAARNFLSYALEGRKKDLNQSIDRLAATRGVELVCKTYSTDQENSRELLRLLFPMLEEPDFEIYYFLNLSEYISAILAYDPAFVEEVYREIFSHTESSTAQTSMGSGVTMNLRSNRKQDFELCYFRLIEFFNTFISQAPRHAIPVGLEVVNNYIISNRSDRYMKLGEEQPFELHGAKRLFLTDLSSIWASNGMNYDKPATIASKIAEFIENCYASNKDIKLHLDDYLNFAKVGYTWKVLIGLGTRVISRYAEYFFEFCITEIFLTSTDTRYDIGQLIEAGATHFTADQIKLIEEKIHAVADGMENRDIEFFKRRYLSRLPEEKLTMQASKDLLKKSGAVENEKPWQSTTSVTSYTTRMHLEELGVDLNDTANNSVLEEAEKLKEFNQTWMNATPSKEQWEDDFKKAAQLFSKATTPGIVLNDHLLYSILSEVAHTYAIISRNINELDDKEFETLKAAIFYCYNYTASDDENINEDASPASGYAPTPKNIAVEALAPIVSREDSTENLDLLTAAVKSKNAVIRFNAVKHCRLIKEKQPLYFNSLMFKGLAQETDAFVAATIFDNIPSQPYDEQQTNKLLETCIANKALLRFNNIFLDNFTLRLIWIYTTCKNELADKILNDAYKQEEFCRTVVFNVFEDFRVSSLNHHKNSEFYIDSSVKWILNYINKTGEILKEIPEAELSNGSTEVKKALNLFDVIIQRIYFMLSRKQFGNRPAIPIGEDNRNFLYKKVKPIFEKLILVSTEIPGGGFIVGHTAHYFIQTLNSVLEYDAKEILSMVIQTTRLSYQTGYTFDAFSIREMINLTEKLLADHRGLLTEKEPFDNLIQLLDIYMESGWNEALELLWKLDEIFK